MLQELWQECRRRKPIQPQTVLMGVPGVLCWTTLTGCGIYGTLDTRVNLKEVTDDIQAGKTDRKRGSHCQWY